MTTGIFESKLLTEIQEHLPSVVVYFWNLAGTAKEIDRAIDSNTAEYKKNK